MSGNAFKFDLLKCGCYTVTGAGKGHKVAAKHTHEIVAVVLSV